VNAEFLRLLKIGSQEGGVAAWNLGQILRAALLTAHRIRVEEIQRVLRGEDGGIEKDDANNDRKWSISSASSTGSSDASTTSSTPSLIYQDFNWVDHGFPLLEALGLEAVAEKFDDEFGAMRKLVDEVGEKGKYVWTEALRLAGVEEEEVEEGEEGEEKEGEEEEKEEVNKEADRNEIRNERADDRLREETEGKVYVITGKEANDENDSDQSEESSRKWALELIEIEARNHATILYILKAVEKFMY